MGEADWVKYAPFVTVFGPIVGALIGAAVTYYITAKRKEVTFFISHSEDLIGRLREHEGYVQLKAGERELHGFNRGAVIVRNTGNAVISDFQFLVEIPGHHPFHFADVIAADVLLKEQTGYTTNWKEGGSSLQNRVSIRFFNPGEQFELVMCFDGEPTDCNVYCRMADVKSKVKHPSDYGEKVGVFTGALVRALVRG
jgi:hypothetical protein